MGRSLLVTGDDFGASAEANAAIVAAHVDGILTCASLMVTGAAGSEAVARARELPDLSTGLHLVLCDGLAASPPESVPDLVDAQGRFATSPAAAGVATWWRRRRVRSQLEREIRAQIERYLATGLPLHHVDGHHHLHMHPVVFDILLPCLVEYGVPWVRLVHEDRLGRVSDGPAGLELVPAIFAALARRHRRRLAGRGVRAPERLYGLRATGRVDAAWLLRLLPRLRAESVEVYAHPSRATEAGRREEAALRSRDVRRAVEKAGYRLVGSRAFASDGASAR